MGSTTNTYAATGAVEVTPSDSDSISTCRAVIVGGAGNIKADFKDGTTATFYVAAGVPIAAMLTKIYTTDTTATDIVALY